jgi:putative transposase
MNRKRYPSDLTDQQWELAETLLPPDKKGGRPRSTPRRAILDAYFYLLRGGVSWRMLPHDFPPWRTVYSQVRRWKLDGVWESLHDRLRDEVRLADGRPTQPSAAALDSQSVKTADHPGIRGYDAGKKNQRAQEAHPGRCAGAAAGRGGDAREQARP